MARSRKIQVYALNVQANPHPPGIYLNLLERASRALARAHGSDFAKITPPQKTSEGGVFTGRILVWTEIDLKGKWIDLSNDSDLSTELRKSINIPENARPNFRSFDYVFKEPGHRIYVEGRNTLGASLGNSTAQRIFSTLLSPRAVGSLGADVSVTVVPRSGAVGRVLALPGLRVLEIEVHQPNADTTSERALKRVHGQLDKLHAQKMEQRFVKQSGAARLTPTAEVRELAEAAALSGNVRGEGRRDGKKVELSTVKIPRIEYVDEDAGTSFLSRLLATIGLF